MTSRSEGKTKAGYKWTKLGWLPVEWEVVKLTDLAVIQTGLAKGKKNLKDSVYLPYLRVANVQDGFLDLTEIKLKIVGTAARADTIAHRTDKHINEKMDEDPAFYKRFSELLKETIRAYEERRISEAEYLRKAREIEEAILNRTGSDIPESLRNREIAQAFYGITFESVKSKIGEETTARSVAVDAGIGIDDLIREIVLDNGRPKIDWQHKSDLIGQMEIAIGDFLMDHIRDKYGLKLSFGEIDDIAGKSIEIAKLRYR